MGVWVQGPVITKQPCPQELVACEKREQKMCNTRQQEPQQTQPWQGAYPDLSALNELFSPQAAVNSEQQPSPWIAFLNSLGLQPIPASQPAQQQAQPTQDQPSAPPAPETQQQDGQTFAGTNSAAWGQGQGYHQSAPRSPQQPNGHTCGYSCGAPHISQLLQAITSRLLHFSTVATRASVTFFCIMAFFCILSSLPGFLIQSALYVVLATSLLRLPLPTVLAGHLLYSFITFLHPLCALVLLLPCLHRLHVRGQPLADPANWGVRFTNTAWDQHQNHNHHRH